MTLIYVLLACSGAVREDTRLEVLTSPAGCSAALNTCPDYATSWQPICPDGARCITFVNSCADPVSLAYQVGCNGNGTPGAPQCECTPGSTLATSESVSWVIVDGNYTSCLPSWEPPCLTAGLAVLVNQGESSCVKGTRMEFTAGNEADMYGKFDSYNLDIEKEFYSVPVRFEPAIDCATDHTNHDCRPLFCSSDHCQDAYSTPTNGGCPDGRSPQAACQDTFNEDKGFVVEFCPSDCSTTNGPCPSCEDAKACP